MDVLENHKNGKYMMDVEMPYLSFSSSTEERQQWIEGMDNYYEAKRKLASVVKADFMEEFGDTKTHRGIWEYIHSTYGCLNVKVLYDEFKTTLDFINKS
jgi:hypothetical protein